MFPSLGLESSHRPTMVEVWAPGCSACKAMEPDIRSVSEAHSDQVDLVTVNAVEHRDTARDLGVRGTPTLIGLRNGEEMFRLTGRRSRVELEKLFESLATGDKIQAGSIGFGDLIIRGTAGLALVGVGLVAGPAWPLVAVGVLIALYGLFGWLRWTN